MENILDDICYRIRKFREKSGYTQKQVSNLLNIERSTYSYYEAGKTIPDLKTLIKLSEVFKEPLMNFLENEEKGMLFSDKNSSAQKEDKKISFSGADFSKGNKDSGDIKNENSSDIYKEESKYPKFSSDLSDTERNLIMWFRMLSSKSQFEIDKIMKEKIKEENVFK